MNIEIKKIENGFVVTIGSKQTFCSEAMGICGLLAEWAQAEVDRLEKTPSPGEQLSAAMAQIHAQMMQVPKVRPIPGLSDFSDDFEDAFKYMTSSQVQAKMIESDPTLLEKLKDHVLGKK